MTGTSPKGTTTPRNMRPATVAVILLVIALVAAPWMSTGVDIYVHLIWTQQVMRTLSAGSLPLWLPGLNAGCGSPGIRLYSPGGPVLAGVLGLLAGNAAAGLRIALGAAALLLLVLLARRRVERPAFGLALIAVAPPVLADLATRGAWSELLAIPAAWWLLDRGAAGPAPDSRRWQAEAVALAALWLIHAPTALMVAVLLGLTALLDGVRRFWQLAGAGVTAGALVAWHALPLANEMVLVGNRNALVAGIFRARANTLGAPMAHDPLLNAALSLAGISVLLVVLVEGWPRTDARRAALITLCVGLASPLAAPLWSEGSPLSWLQFPWRWLVPSALLAIRPLALRTPIGNPRSWVLGVLWLAPLLALPLPRLIHAPQLGSSDGWRISGLRLHAAIGANPLLVDATQNRPPWYPQLIRQLAVIGNRLAVADMPGTQLSIRRWGPLHRTISVDAPAPVTVILRLLDYPWWSPTVDAAPARAIRRNGLLQVRVPAGRHTLDVRWTGNPLSRVGQALAAIALLLLGWSGIRRPHAGGTFGRAPKKRRPEGRR